MKFALASDVHLEFGTITLKNTENADVLLLAGDICVADTIVPKDRYCEFFENCCKNFPEVVYIAGNHEHYHGDFKFTYEKLRNTLKHLPNLHILDCESFTLGDTTFLGGTLWTDMNKNDELTHVMIKNNMNDFAGHIVNSHNMIKFQSSEFLYDDNGELIFLKDEGRYKSIKIQKERPSLFKTTDAVEQHERMLKFIDEETKDTNKKFVVVGHHCPSRRSTHPKYTGDYHINGGYSSDLDQFIIDRPNIKAWVHGHTHNDFDYMVGDTRILCNPRGYINYETRATYWNLKYFEV